MGRPARGVDLRRISKLLSPRHDLTPFAVSVPAGPYHGSGRHGPSQVCPHSAGGRWSIQPTADSKIQLSLDASLGMELGSLPVADNAVLAGRSIRQNGTMAQSMTMPRPPPTRVTSRVRWWCWTPSWGPGASGRRSLIYGLSARFTKPETPGSVAPRSMRQGPITLSMAVRTGGRQAADGRPALPRPTTTGYRPRFGGTSMTHLLSTGVRGQQRWR